MKNKLVLLPPEIKELSLKVSEEKQKEVQTVLTQIFQGTADWNSQIDAIEVKDINDSMSIQLADTARKNAKTARLSAEKLFDSKRSEVQLRMSDDKLEDALWLKSKQIMQLKFKAIEEKAQFKADFVKRFNQEQKELKTQLRLEKIIKFNPEINRIEIENLSDEMFENVLTGLEKTHNDKIEAEKKSEEERIEKERLVKLHNDRKNSILDLWQFVEDEIKDTDFSDLNDTDWINFVEALRNEKLKFDEDQEKIRKENERLYKEKKAKEEKEAALKLRNDKRNKELRPYIVFIRDYNKMLDLDEKAYQKELLDIKEGAKLQHEFDVKEAQKKADKEAKELREKENLRLRLQAKEEKERKEKQRLLDEQMQKTKAEKAARLAPDKDKLLKFADDLNNLELPELKSVEASEILKNIVNLLGKTTGYIREKAKSL